MRAGAVLRVRVLTVAGLLGLALWASVWALSLAQERLKGGRFTWVPCWEWLGCDFEHNYFAARHWLAGANPYDGFPARARGGWDKYSYPPLLLPLFAWCNFVGRRAAVALWLAALAGLAGLGAVACCRTRRALGLGQLPVPAALALVLASTPVLFAMERGNCDLLVLGLLLPAAWLLQAKSPARDVAAGTCLALAAWIKLYPGLLIVGLLTLRR
jgi:hypothetical protein